MLSAEVVKENMPMVRSIAGQWVRKTPASVLIDDLVQIGWEAVMELAGRVNPATLDFKKIAPIAIKCRIIDRLRELDHMPRNSRDALKAIQKAEAKLEQLLLRKPSSREVVREAGVDLDTYFWTVGNSAVGAIVDIDFYDEDSAEHWNTNYYIKERHLTNKELHDVVNKLRSRHRQCIHLRYFSGMNNREVGEVFGVTEARAHQIHAAALSRIREILNIDARLGDKE